jgi:hypothetical protein
MSDVVDVSAIEELPSVSCSFPLVPKVVVWSTLENVIAPHARFVVPEAVKATVWFPVGGSLR